MSKDDGIEKLEKVIGKKSQKIVTLQSEITSLQAKGSIAAEEQAGKANARPIELEKQTEQLKKDITVQNNKKEARAGDTEKKVQELNASWRDSKRQAMSKSVGSRRLNRLLKLLRRS